VVGKNTAFQGQVRKKPSRFEGVAADVVYTGRGVNGIHGFAPKQKEKKKKRGVKNF